jgi:hypothetical protein
MREERAEGALFYTYPWSTVRNKFRPWLATWKGNPFFMAVSSPSYQAPCLKSTALVPLAFPSLPAPASLTYVDHFFLYIKTTLTSPILLSGTSTDAKSYTNNIYSGLDCGSNQQHIFIRIFGSVTISVSKLSAECQLPDRYYFTNFHTGRQDFFRTGANIIF